MSKKIIFSTIVTVAGLGSAALGVFGANRPFPVEPAIPSLSVEIKTNGIVAVRGAKVSEVATSTLVATTNWGSSSLSWRVNAGDSTEILRRYPGQARFSEIAPGHTISFRGSLDQTSPGLIVQAKVVRDWSIERITLNVFGVVTSRDAGAKRFVIQTEEHGPITVVVMDATQILKSKATTTFDAITVGMRVGARGAWDRTAKILQADQVKVHREERRVFSNGRLQSLPTTSVPPTSIMVRFGGVDYTVNISPETAILNRNWEAVSLSDLKSGDHIRVYGVRDELAVDATVVRDVDLK